MMTNYIIQYNLLAGPPSFNVQCPNEPELTSTFLLVVERWELKIG